MLYLLLSCFACDNLNGHVNVPPLPTGVDSLNHWVYEGFGSVEEATLQNVLDEVLYFLDCQNYQPASYWACVKMKITVSSSINMKMAVIDYDLAKTFIK
jgi:hypothetical protein